jgi:hypothetical protein
MVEGKSRIWEILMLTGWIARDPAYRRGIETRSLGYRYPATRRKA